MPLLSTNRMPVRAARSSRRGLPPLGLGGSSGNSGSTNSQSSSLTNSLAILLPYPDSAVLKGSLSSFNDYLLEIVVVAAFVLTLVTLAGLHAAQRHSGRYGILGAAGFWLTFLGYVVVMVTVHLTLLAGDEPILSVRLVGGLLVLVGSIL